MKSNKERLYYYMQEMTSKSGSDFKGFTTQQLADALKMQRTNLSALLNVLVTEKKVDKINGRPVTYKLAEKMSLHEENTCFANLIGYKTTLKNAIQLAKAAILYPEEPLVTLISGQKGVGKSFFASLMVEYAKSQNIIKASAPYVKFNCSYYEGHEEDLIVQLFGKNEHDQECALHRALDGAIFIDHIECLSAKAKNRLFTLIENRRMLKCPVIICAVNADGVQVHDEVLFSKFPVMINLPSFEQRSLDERLQLVQKFFVDEAIKMKKEIKINSELLRCFLLYYCEGNIKQLKSDIRIGCANAYVRIIQNQDEKIYVYMNDCPSYVRKGFLFYKDHRDEVESLIPHNFAYTFGRGEIRKSVGFNEPQENTLYDTIEKKARTLRERGVEEEDISTVISADVEVEISRYTRKFDSGDVNRDSLAKIVDKEIIEEVDALLRSASQKFNRVYSSSTFSGLCLYVSNLVQRTGKAQQLSSDKIMEIINDHKDEYALCLQFSERIEKRYNSVEVGIDDVIMMTMFLCQRDIGTKKRRPVLLIAMHGRVASSIANVINAFVKTNKAYAYDLLLDKDMNEAYEELKQICRQIDQGLGILLMYDMGSIKKMMESIAQETGILIKMIELPSTLIALDAMFRLTETEDINEAYYNIINNQYSLIGTIQDTYNRNAKSTSKVIVTLCMTGKGTALQMKKYLENNVVFDANTTIVPLAVSDKDVLYDAISQIMEKSSIQCLIGTYNPKFYGIPFISIATLFETPVEKLPMLMELERDETVSEIDYNQMYEYLSEQLDNVDINKLKRHLRPAVIKIKHLVNDTSPELEVGLFVHIACSIGRMINHEPMPINVKKDQILNRNKTLYNDLKDILSPMEKAMGVKFTDDELAIIIEIIK